MSTFVERLEHVFKVAQEKKTDVHLSINGLYGVFEAYFDPGNQGLDPIPEYTNGSLMGILSDIEKHLGIE